MALAWVGWLRSGAIFVAVGLMGHAALAAPVPTRPPVKAKAPSRPPMLQSLQVIPSEITLDGPRGEQQLLVSGRFSDGMERDLSAAVQFRSAAPKIVRITKEGRVTGVADGVGWVKVAAGALSGWVKVTGKNVAADIPINFRDEVIPLLTRAGCNQGACHGSAAGKGGFKLSLLGYDPESDYTAIVEQNKGRRVVVTQPEQSLLLMKPTLGVPHGGGLRFRRDSHEYEVIAAWLRDGAPAPVASDPVLSSIEVLPAHRLADLSHGASTVVAFPEAAGKRPVRFLRLGQTQQLIATARFADGRTEDITRKAQFKSLNDALAEVETSGAVTVGARGETSVMVRYRGQATVSRFTAPYRKLAKFPDLPRGNFIDDLVAAKWKEMDLLPSGTCTDAEFIRRAYLDVLGILPTPEEIQTFTASADPTKRAALVDRVLARPEYVDYWTLKWGDLLRNNSDKVQAKGMWSFYNWLRSAFRANMPLDQFARELVTAQGSAYTNGPANYFRIATSPSELAETTSQVFLGVRLACARCHHHPFEKWSQDDYWQMAAFFARVGLKGSDEFGIFGGEQVVRLNPTGEVSNPRTGKQLKPTPLDGVPMDDPLDRRRALAQWLTRPDNAFFSRSIVNRYWAYLNGRGIVDPIDDIRVTNPASNPELLDALAKDFVTHGFDPKHLLRTIMTSRTYQLSSNPIPENRQDEVFYTKYAARRLEAEELLDALNFATGTTDKFPNLPAGMRAVQLPDPSSQNDFLDTFGRPAREITCECERSVEPNMAQALHLMNSDFVQEKISGASGRLGKLLASSAKDDAIVQELYLVTFSRPPSAQELTQAQKIVKAAPNRKEGMEDLFWALLNSREFLFKH